ncbi:MAG: hypothetical protein WBG86_02425 [Polyangiales bacterium]
MDVSARPVVLYAVPLVMWLAACGSDPQSDVCNTATSALVANCDANDPEDVRLVSTSLTNACGITDFTASDLNSPGALKSLCLDALAGTSVSDSEAASFAAVMATKTGCMSVANNVGLACRDFL